MFVSVFYFIALTKVLLTPNKDTLKLFNIKKFNKQTKGDDSYTFIVNEENTIEEIEDYDDEGYMRLITLENTNIYYITKFYPDINLESSSKKIFDTFFCKSEKYDTKGKFISIVNNEEGYNISIDDILQKVLEEFGLVILLKNSNTNVHKYKNAIPYLKIPNNNYNLVWITIYTNKHDSSGNFYKIKIDADTLEELEQIPFYKTFDDNCYLKGLIIYWQNLSKQQYIASPHSESTKLYIKPTKVKTIPRQNGKSKNKN